MSTQANPFAPRCALDPDRRQSPAAAAIGRGAMRLLRRNGLSTIAEVTLSTGRRADIVALAETGEIWIVEVKSCLADFRADLKWHEYQAYADRLWFAVGTDFPLDVLPETAGHIVCDAYGGGIEREAPVVPLAAARRKAMHLRFARVAADRLARAIDPAPLDLHP